MTNKQVSKIEKAVMADIQAAVHNHLTAVFSDIGEESGKRKARAKIVRNGIQKPNSGITAKIWGEFDKQRPRDIHKATEMADKKGWNIGTARAQFYLWKRFHA